MKEPQTKQQALGMARWHTTEAGVRLRSMNIGGQRTYEYHMRKAVYLRELAETLPEEL
jgi:hypothetical protein